MQKRNNNIQHDETPEDGPEYRSVAIQPLSSPIMPRPLAPLRKRSSSPMKTSIHACHDTAEELDGPDPLSFRWRVQELPELSPDYTLLRTNVYVKDSSAQLVANRICNVLRASSISIDDLIISEEGNYLEVETRQGTRLSIRLFGDNDMVVVEVRRLMGCTFDFRDASRTILRASKGVQQGERSFPPRRFSIPPTIPKRSRESHHKCINDDFQSAYTMLQSEKCDIQILAIESMEKMMKSCGAQDVVAKLILWNCDCLKRLVSLLESCDGADQSGLESGHSSILRRNILGVVASSFEAISESDLTEVLSMEGNGLIARPFLSSLLSCVQEAISKPHDAFEAVRCLRYLLTSKDVEAAMMEMSAMDVISSARSAGINCHQGLELESNKLMAQLLNVY